METCTYLSHFSLRKEVSEFISCHSANYIQYYLPYYIVPESRPHNVSGNRLPNNTVMNVSFIGLSIAEAHSVNITYTVRYSSVEFQKRQSHVKEVVVPDNQHHMIIGGLDQSTTYHVVVDASNNNGTVSSSPITVYPGIYS